MCEFKFRRDLGVLKRLREAPLEKKERETFFSYKPKAQSGGPAVEAVTPERPGRVGTGSVSQALCWCLGSPREGRLQSCAGRQQARRAAWGWRLEAEEGSGGAGHNRPSPGALGSALPRRPLDTGSKASPGDWRAGHQTGIPGKMLDPKVLTGGL